MRVFRSSSLLVALTAPVFTVTATRAFAQDSGLPVAKLGTRPVFTARLVQPLQQPRTVSTDSVKWSCRERACTTIEIGGQWPDLNTCRSLRREIGEIEDFGHAGHRLSSSELRLCNSPLLNRPPGAVVFGDGRPGARLPDAAGPRPGEVTPELTIVDVRRGSREEIRPGEKLPVLVLVRNIGGRPVTVRPASRDLSQGPARFGQGPEARIGPGETVTLGLDLVATGSAFSFNGRGGGALCGERSERTIFLLEEAPAPSNPAGWRSGNSAGADAWLPFHDRNDADHERTVSFRFDCFVTLER